MLQALEREEPPQFPIEANLLPAAKARVRLAMRLDDVMRSSSKQAAHKSWEAQAAEAAGIDLSDGEDEESSTSTQAEKLRQVTPHFFEQFHVPKDRFACCQVDLKGSQQKV